MPPRIVFSPCFFFYSFYSFSDLMSFWLLLRFFWRDCFPTRSGLWGATSKSLGLSGCWIWKSSMFSFLMDFSLRMIGSWGIGSGRFLPSSISSYIWFISCTYLLKFKISLSWPIDNMPSMVLILAASFMHSWFGSPFTTKSKSMLIELWLLPPTSRMVLEWFNSGYAHGHALSPTSSNSASRWPIESGYSID